MFSSRFPLVVMLFFSLSSGACPTVNGQYRCTFKLAGKTVEAPFKTLTKDGLFYYDLFDVKFSANPEDFVKSEVQGLGFNIVTKSFCGSDTKVDYFIQVFNQSTGNWISDSRMKIDIDGDKIHGEFRFEQTDNSGGSLVENETGECERIGDLQ